MEEMMGNNMENVPTDQASPDDLDIAIEDLASRTRDDGPWTAFDIWDHDNAPNDFDGHIADILNAVIDGRLIRADLAAPSAPAEVEGLVGGETRTLAVDAVWKPCVHGGGWWIAKNADGGDVLLSSDTPQAVTALTAQQAEIDRLTAERDEALAQRDTWMECAMSELGDNLAAHAKLNGEV